MASNEGHIHWTGTPNETVTFLNQEIQMTSERTNMSTTLVDPVGTVRIKASGFANPGVALPNSSASEPTWTTIPGTSPALEVRVDGHYPMGYIRIRQA
jgi:hypothetical protein